MKPIRLRIDDDKYRKIIRGGYGTDLTPNVGDPPPARNEVDIFVTADQLERIKEQAGKRGVTVEEV